MDESDDKLVYASATPQVSELIAEFRRCSPFQSGWHRVSANDQTRFCLWPGQDPDGKKWDENQPEGKRAFPFNGASDARTFAIDEAIEEIVAIEFVSFFRAILKIQGVEMGDLEASGYVRKLLEWVVGTKQFYALVREVELHSQYTHTYGWSVLHVCWLQEHVLKLVELTLNEVVTAAQQAAIQATNDLVAALPAMIMDPAQEANFVDTITALTPGLTAKRARTMARDLRTRGAAKVPMPMVVSNEPLIRALKPWEEVFISNQAIDIQHARVFIKEWLTEVQLRSLVHTEGWNAKWVEEAVKEKGKASAFGSGITENMHVGSLIAADGFTLFDGGTELIEVIHSYCPQVDDEGIPGIYRTTFHAAIERDDLCAKHELLDYRHGRQPFIVRKREQLSRTITSSRGLPEILFTTQRSGKCQEDAVVDSTSLSVMPPILVPELTGVEYDFVPGGQIPVPIAGRGPTVMQFPTPGVPVAFNLIEMLSRRIGRRIGRRYPEEAPEGADAQRQKLVHANLASWSAAFQQEFQLLEQFLPTEEFTRITGAPEGMPQDADSIARQYDFILTFDIRELSIDYVMEELKAIKDVILPVDAMGVIDRSKLVELLLRAINPTLAKELILNPQSASQQVFQKVKIDFISMMAGFEPELVEMDPTAGAQLGFAKQLIQSNPRVQQAFQSDRRFAELVQKWQQNRQQSVVQEQNKMVGRLGVKPEAEAAAYE